MGAEERAALIAEARDQVPFAACARDAPALGLSFKLADALEAAGEEIAALEERLAQAKAALGAVAQEIPFTSLTSDTAQALRTALSSPEETL